MKGQDGGLADRPQCVGLACGRVGGIADWRACLRLADVLVVGSAGRSLMM